MTVSEACKILRLVLACLHAEQGTPSVNTAPQLPGQLAGRGRCEAEGEMRLTLTTQSNPLDVQTTETDTDDETDIFPGASTNTQMHKCPQ